MYSTCVGISRSGHRAPPQHSKIHTWHGAYMLDAYIAINLHPLKVRGSW